MVIANNYRTTSHYFSHEARGTNRRVTTSSHWRIVSLTQHSISAFFSDGQDEQRIDDQGFDARFKISLENKARRGKLTRLYSVLLYDLHAHEMHSLYMY